MTLGEMKLFVLHGSPALVCLAMYVFPLRRHSSVLVVCGVGVSFLSVPLHCCPMHAGHLGCGPMEAYV
jgi:hypothetical protein